MRTSKEEISERAYATWVRNGRPQDTWVQDWLHAEAELKVLTAQALVQEDRGLHNSGQLLQAILDHSAAVIHVKDLQGRYLLVNRACRTLFQATPEEVVGKTDHDLFPTAVAEAFRANDRRVLAAATPLEFTEFVPQDDGMHTYVSLKLAVSHPSGRPCAICGISTDVTERNLAKGRLQAEHAVTRALTAAAVLADAAPAILEAICASLDWEVGILWEVHRPSNVLRCVQVWHVPEVAIPAFDQVNRQMSFAPDVGLPGAVWASGQPRWVANFVADASLPRASAALQEGLHAACGFPFHNGHETLGVLEFFSRAIREPDQNVLAMMASIGSQLSQFAERRQAEKAFHARDQELHLARAIQQRSVPKVAPALAGFDVGGASYPAQETGGDYFDFIPLHDDCLAIAVGDASGHGMAAALVIAETRAYLRALAHTDPDPGRVLSGVNRLLAEDLCDDRFDFVTLFLAQLNPHTHSLVYSSAGHWPGYILDARGDLKTTLPSTTLPLGLDPTVLVPCAPALTLEVGELVLLLSDGIVEAFSPEGVLFGKERALAAVRDHRGAPSRAIVAALLDEVRTFSHDVQLDDMTAVVIKVQPV